MDHADHAHSSFSEQAAELQGLVLDGCISLAARAIELGVKNDLSICEIEDHVQADQITWHLTASYSRAFAGVMIEGHPCEFEGLDEDPDIDDLESIHRKIRDIDEASDVAEDMAFQWRLPVAWIARLSEEEVART
jgi:hypothetical protein